MRVHKGDAVTVASGMRGNASGGEASGLKFLFVSALSRSRPLSKRMRTLPASADALKASIQAVPDPWVL
jgi:hypothetical protein